MTLLAAPNVSEGRDQKKIATFASLVAAEGVRVLDIHSDATHNRSVLTLTGTCEQLTAGCCSLARAALTIDLEIQSGAHPRLGGLDVCPFVPHDTTMDEAVRCARATAARIGTDVGLPVYLYGHAATRPEARELPDLRRGGLASLIQRARAGLLPDHGPPDIDGRTGVVCVGARGPLIAFNVWMRTDARSARAIASRLRSPAVRALGLAVDEQTAQVSMNLIDPAHTGIQEVFQRALEQARSRGIEIVATEVVGLVERRFLPAPDATVTRLLVQPGHCLEERLEEQAS